MAGNHDRSSIGGRIRRYAQVTGTMSGLAARLAGERYRAAYSQEAPRGPIAKYSFAASSETMVPR